MLRGWFAPDWVHGLEIRSGGSHNTTFDTVRGAGQSIKHRRSAEQNILCQGHLTAFGSDGFTLGDNTGNGNTNQASATFVAWEFCGGTAPTQTYTVKVVSDSGNKYRFDDFGTSAVTLNLQEGAHIHSINQIVQTQDTL
ncbi:MAG: hypothetical protein CM15mV104_040 [Caudoviricetes sp.]|nr:MAG: hypothetical protein CM15mV104_040 [Caudoviricetes sp.]